MNSILYIFIDLKKRIEVELKKVVFEEKNSNRRENYPLKKEEEIRNNNTNFKI